MIRKIQIIVFLFLFLGGIPLDYGQDLSSQWVQSLLIENKSPDTHTIQKIQLPVALKRLERKFRVSFIYKSSLLDDMYVVPEAKLSDNFGQELLKLLAPFPLTYEQLNNRTIIINSTFAVESQGDKEIV